MTKILVNEPISYYNINFRPSDIDGTIDQVIEQFRKVEAEIKAANPKTEKVCVTFYSGYYDEPSDLNFSILRLETDEEYQDRLVKAEKQRIRNEKARERAKIAAATRKANKEQYERKEFERLRKKFEG